MSKHAGKIAGALGGGSTKTVYNPTAIAGTQGFLNYLNGLDTSTVDNTQKNLANNAYALSSQMPDYVYNVDGSDAARQRMENAVYSQAVNKMNQQFDQQRTNLQTSLQNQGLAVGSQAYQNAMNSFNTNYNDALTNAAYESISQGQSAFSQSLNDSISAGSFTNSARQMTLNEILQSLSQNVSGYQVAQDKFNAANQGQSMMKVKSGSSFGLGEAANVGASLAPVVSGMMSDERLKENLKPVGKLDNGLTVYSFNFLGSPVTQIGLIAQEVEEVIPEAVSQDEDGYLRVDYKLASE